MDFAESLRRAVADLQAACGVAVVWKDADPRWWARLPPAVSQHRNPHCLAVKQDRIRLARCIGEDGLEGGDFKPDETFRIRTCPFGVSEVLVPVRAGGIYHGCCLVGPWRGAAGTSALPTHGGLAPPPSPARLAAIARVVEAVIAPLVADRTASRAAAAAAADPAMAAARDWIEAHLSARLRVRESAAAAGLSPSRFVHRFAVACGTPFGPYVRGRLMEEAARRLADPSVTVASVAASLGYASHARFSAAFRQIHGCPPSAYRRRRGA